MSPEIYGKLAEGDSPCLTAFICKAASETFDPTNHDHSGNSSHEPKLGICECARIAYATRMLSRILPALLAAILILAIGGLGLYVWFGDNANSGPNAMLSIQLGKVQLAIPAAYIRNPEARVSGEFVEAEIAANAKDFRPATRLEKLRPGVEDASEGIVYMTLREQENTLDPAERPARLYVRFLEQEEWSHPGGLVMRRFDSASPFGREDLYMAPPEGRVFAARCMRPQQPPDGLPNTCISEMRMQGLDIRLRFSPNLLSDWEQLAAGVRGLVKSIVK